MKNNRVGIPIDEERMAWFTPQEDITAYQLAKILEVLLMATISSGHGTKAFWELPAGCRKHFDYTGSDGTEEAA